MTTLQIIGAIASAVVTIGGIILWYLKRYKSLEADIEKAERLKDELDEKLKKATYTGDGKSYREHSIDRERVSKRLQRLYKRQSSGWGVFFGRK